MYLKTLAGLIAGLALLVTACGSDDATNTAADPYGASGSAADEPAGPETEPDTDTDTSTGTDPASGEDAQPVGEDVPQAIVSLSPTATEMLFALGAADQVLAVDDFSNYPPETADKMTGLDAFQPSPEAVAGLAPDLVITDGTNPEFLAQLDSVGIPHWDGPAAVTFDDVYTQIEQLGAVTGRVGEAAELVAQMQIEVDEVKAGLPDLGQPLTYYHELDDAYFSVTSETFIGAVYAELGLVNIADEVDNASTPYPQLSAEYIITENPDLIFLACSKYCGTDSDAVAARPGWESITAVSTGGVIEMDDDIASRWGPRIVDYLRTAGQAVDTVATTPVAG